MREILNKLIVKLGKKDYILDSNLSASILILIVLNKLISLIRGMFLKLRLKKSKGLIFMKRGVKIKFSRKIILGKTITIGNNVYIDALSKKGIIIGDNVSILDNSIIECTGVLRNLGEGLIIGNNVGIAQNCFIQVRGKVSIGNDVIFGPYVKVFSENHNFEDLEIPIKNQGETRLEVIIEDNVWVGANATILGGVVIGKGSIVAANALVNKSVAPYSIVGGVPARIIKNRN